MSHRPKFKELRPKQTGEIAVSRAELDLLRQKTADLISQKAEKAAIILTSWLNRPSVTALSRKKSG
jgi:hypothetical protein